MNNSKESSLPGEHNPEDSPDKQLRDFKAEMTTLKAEEEQARKLKSEGADVLTPWHFGKVNPAELVSEDRDMWEQVRSYMTGAVRGNETLLLTLFENYKRRVQASGNPSRIGFYGFIANKVGIIFGRSEIDKGAV